MKGIISSERGKRNIERMVEKNKNSEYESQQHLISKSTWESQGVLKSIAKEYLFNQTI